MKNKHDDSGATNIISIDETAVKDKLNEVVRDTVEETLTANDQVIRVTYIAFFGAWLLHVCRTVTMSSTLLKDAEENEQLL